MSALTDLFTAMANKIRSKTGTQTLYTPAQMVSDGIDDVYDAGYAAGGGGSSATSITPSDSSPVAMTANNAYKPTTNGYAIASNPTTLTPSSASPQSIVSGTIYKGGGSGYAIDSYSSISPSSDGTYFTSGFQKMTSPGYAYSSQPNVKIGLATLSPSGQTTIPIGFKPKYICYRVAASSYGMEALGCWDERFSKSSAQIATSSIAYQSYTIGSSQQNYRINSITSTGFVMNKCASNITQCYYFAIG